MERESIESLRKYHINIKEVPEDIDLFRLTNDRGSVKKLMSFASKTTDMIFFYPRTKLFERLEQVGVAQRGIDMSCA